MDKLKRIVKGYVIGIVVFVLLSLIGAVILKLTPFRQDWSFIYLVAIMSIACFILSIYLGRFFQKAGLICGLVSSVLLIILILIGVDLSFTDMPALNSLSPYYLIPVGIGAVGGVIGTNMSK